MSLHIKRLTVITGIVGLILLVPAIAMQFTSEVNWSLSDFLVAGFILFGFGFAFNLILTKVPGPNLRIGLIVIGVVCLLLIWMELAVGLLGTPFAGN